MNHGRHLNSDEITCPMSYYVLYCNSNALQVSAETATTQKTTTTAVDDEITSNKAIGLFDDANEDDDADGNHTSLEHQPWVEDHWTAEDESQAAALLEANFDRCRVSLHSSVRSKSRTTKAKSTVTTASTLAWDRFYENHTTNFFKDRHYLDVAFPHEFGNGSDCQPTTSSMRCLVEIGCGVGNAMLPLLENDTPPQASPVEESKALCEWTVHGLDMSEVAIALLQQDARFQQAIAVGRATANVCDITHGIPQHVHQVATVTSLLFCLSAIDPIHHAVAVQNAASTLRRPTRGMSLEGVIDSSTTLDNAKGVNDNGDSGGVLVFRDYGRYDAAHLKLGTQRGKLLTSGGCDANTSSKRHAFWYRKHDGTQCYYFTIEEVQQLMEQAGLETIECHYIQRVYCNRSTGAPRRRVWVQGRFRTKGHSVPN